MDSFTKFLTQDSLSKEQAAAGFLFIKQGEYTDLPDGTGKLEGTFAAPLEDVVLKMGEVATAKIRLAMTYRVYSETLRDPSNTALGKHFQDHCKDELGMADYLNRRASVLLGPVHLGEISTPPPATDLTTILHTLIRAEQESIAELRELHTLMGENPMKYELEQFMALDQHHMDDLYQHIPYQAQTTPGQPKVASFPWSKTKGKEDAEELRAKFKIKPEDKDQIIKDFTKKRVNQGKLLGLTGLGALGGGVGAGLGELLGRTQTSVAAGNILGFIAAGALGYHLGAKSGKSNAEDVVNMAHAGFKGEVANKIRTGLEARTSKVKTASQQPYVEQYHPDTFHLHGPVMQLALLNMRPTVFVPGSKYAAPSTLPLAPTGQAAGQIDMPPPPTANPAIMPGTQASTVTKTSQQAEVTRVRNKLASLAKRALNLDPRTQQYLQREDMNEREARNNEVAFLRSQTEQAQQAAQVAAQQAQQASSQVQELQGQLSQAQEQMQSTMQSAQSVQQSALQSAQQAQVAAAQAMKETVTKGTELMAQMQLANTIRNHAQSLQQSMLAAAQEPLPPATVFEQGVANTGAMAPPVDQGVPGQMGVESNPTQGAEQGPGLQATPGMQPQSEVQSSEVPAQDNPTPKTAGIPLKAEHIPRIVGGLTGAGLMLGATHMARDEAANNKLRQKIRKLEEQESSGNGGFSTAMSLAKDRMRLSVNEAATHHPVATSIMAAASGAMAGQGIGHNVKNIIDKVQKLRSM